MAIVMPVRYGAELGTWWGLKTPGLMDPGVRGLGAQDLWY